MKAHPQISQISQIGKKICVNLRHLRTPLPPKTAALAIIVLFYLATGGFCLPESEARPTWQPTPLAKWAAPVQRDDPRPFLIRLLLSIRWDFYHKDIRGGADF